MPKPNIFLEPVIYSSIQVRPRAQLRVFTTPWKGRLKIHIRELYRYNDTDEYQMGRGIAIDPDDLEEIIQGLILAQQTIEENGENLIDARSES